VGAAGGAAVVVTELIFFLFSRFKIRNGTSPPLNAAYVCINHSIERLFVFETVRSSQFTDKFETFAKGEKETGEGGRGEKMEVILAIKNNLRTGVAPSTCFLPVSKSESYSTRRISIERP
jgi:hypothetical protein